MSIFVNLKSILTWGAKGAFGDLYQTPPPLAMTRLYDENIV